MPKYKGGKNTADLSFKAEMCLGYKADGIQGGPAFSFAKQLEWTN